jgi:hypothetical protein
MSNGGNYFEEYDMCRKLTTRRGPRAMLAAFVVFLAGAGLAAAADSTGGSTNETRTIVDFTQGMTRLGGFLPLYRQERDGALFLEISASGTPDLLYQVSLASGLGRREVALGPNLDRGYFGPSRLVTFRRFGGKVLLVERNTNYYTPSAEFGSARDSGNSFPDSVIAAFDIEAEERGALLVDATKLFQRDGIGIAAALKAAGERDYALDDHSSSVDSFSAKASDQSIDVEAALTFTPKDTAPADKDLLSDVVANRDALLVREHYSLFKLADANDSLYKPRLFDPRAGYFDRTFYDPAQLPNRSLRRSYIRRQQLIKSDPSTAVNEPRSQIVFYIDPSVPVELRQWVTEAVLWWNPAFAAAGFPNALKVEDLPPDIDPLSIGVNVITWVARSTRGFSWTNSVVDPRTGQILKALICLDAMRLGADRLLFDALTAPYTDHPDLDDREAALRQRFELLVAHEVGHALGLRHQYIGSAQGNSSVMDYPFPNITLDADGTPRLRNVFLNAVGPWDKFMIQYGYQSFAPNEEAALLSDLIDGVERQGFYWMTDEDSGDADPFVQIWDLGADPVAALNTVLSIRKAALQRFSRAAIPADEPLATLQDALAPVYLLHKFAVKPVAAMLGGFTYRHAMRDQAHPEPVSPEQQRQALHALLSTLDPATLNPGNHILELMSPRPGIYPATPESFTSSTGVIFDALRPIEDAASITMQEILKPSRTARMAQSSMYDPRALGLKEVLNTIVDYTWKGQRQDGDVGVAQRAIAVVVVQSLLAAIGQQDSTSAVRGTCWLVLDDLQEWMKAHPPTADWEETYAYVSHAVKQDPTKFAPNPFPSPPLDPM